MGPSRLPLPHPSSVLGPLPGQSCQLLLFLPPVTIFWSDHFAEQAMTASGTAETTAAPIVTPKASYAEIYTTSPKLRQLLHRRSTAICNHASQNTMAQWHPPHVWSNQTPSAVRTLQATTIAATAETTAAPVATPTHHVLYAATTASWGDVMIYVV